MNKNKRIDIVKDLKVGEKVSGTVKSFQPYGAFIELDNGVVGLAHIEDLSVARIRTPAERLKLGQKVDIIVKSINKENGRIILSYKEMFGSWEENAKGIIKETEKNKNGIFVELTPNLVGMAEYQTGLEYGEEVDVYIKKIDPDKKKVKLVIL